MSSKDLSPQAQAETKHTPWEVTETFWASLPGEPKSVYCWNVQGDDLWLTNIRTLEQARLISAAPELLKALKAMTRLAEVLADDTTEKEVGYGGKTVRENIHDAKAVIAKAEKRP